MKKATSYIDLSRVEKLTKGDPVKMQRYLHQFLELIPEKIDELKTLQINENREKIRELIHHIGPHLVYFGVPEVNETLKFIESNINTIPFSELRIILNKLLFNINKAIEEISNIAAKYLDKQ